MKGKLAIKAQTYNQDGFDSSVCVCNRLLKTLWEGLKIPKVASEPQWSVLSDAGPSDNRRNLTLYHKAILTTTSQFVLFFTEPVQTLYKMKSDILCLKEVTSMDKTPIHLAFSLRWVNRSHDVCSVLWHTTYSCLDFLSCSPLLIVCRVTGDLCETHPPHSGNVFPHLALQLLPGAFRMAFPSIVLREWGFTEVVASATLEESWGVGWRGRISRKCHLPDFLIHRKKPHLKIPPRASRMGAFRMGCNPSWRPCARVRLEATSPIAHGCGNRLVTGSTLSSSRLDLVQLRDTYRRASCLCS